MKDVQQVAVEAGVEKVVTTALHRSQFLVKNFTGYPITVKLGDNTNASTIGAGSWERVFNNVDNEHGESTPAVTNTLKITATEDGMVEVAAIDW